MDGYVYSVMAAVWGEHPDDAQRHIARREWRAELHAHVPKLLCPNVAHKPIDAMWTPLVKIVGGQYIMWPKPTCERCLTLYQQMVSQKAAAE